MQDINIKQIKALIALCRKQGVTSIKVGTIELNLADLPAPRAYNKAAKKESNVSPANDAFVTDGPSKEELLMWSTGVSNPLFEEEQAS